MTGQDHCASIQAEHAWESHSWAGSGIGRKTRKKIANLILKKELGHTGRHCKLRVRPEILLEKTANKEFLRRAGMGNFRHGGLVFVWRPKQKMLFKKPTTLPKRMLEIYRYRQKHPFTKRSVAPLEEAERVFPLLMCGLPIRMKK